MRRLSPERDRAYNHSMTKKKEEPRVKWVETHTGVAAQQALSDLAKRAKLARRAPAKAAPKDDVSDLSLSDE